MPYQDAHEKILQGSQRAQKTFTFAEQDPTYPAQWWFQNAEEGVVLFAVFYTLACRWNRCVGCNLPSKSSIKPVSYQNIIAQIDHLFSEPAIIQKRDNIRKVILSNNGSVLDQITFPSTALMYFLATMNLKLPTLNVLSIETRVEHVEWEELEFIARALRERETEAQLELAVGFEAFDERVRNRLFNKGLSLEDFERLVIMVAKHGYALKCYFMLKPVVQMSDEEAIQDIHRAIDWLDSLAMKYKIKVNIHLNPTYVAHGTPIEKAFKNGDYSAPLLTDLARAARHARGRNVSIYLGLSDEGLAVPGGSFIREGEEERVARLERFNSSQNFDFLEEVAEAK